MNSLQYNVEKIIKIQNESVRVFIISYSNEIITNISRGGVFDPLGQIGNWIVTQVKNFVDNVIKPGLDTIIDNFLKPIWDFLNKTVVENFLKPIWNTLEGIGKTIMDSIGGVLSGIFNMVAQGFAGLVNMIAQGISKMIDALVGVFKWLIDKITAPFRKLLEIVSTHSPMRLEEVPVKMMEIFGAVLLVAGPSYLLMDLASGKLFGAGFNFSGVKKFFSDIWKAIVPVTAIFGAFAMVGLVPWIHRYVKASFRPWLPDMHQITWFYYNNYLSAEEAKNFLAQHGVPDNLIHAVIHYNTFRFSFQDIYTLRNLGLITEADAIKLVKMHNVPEAFANIILTLQQPKFSWDLIFFLWRNKYITKEERNYWFKLTGVPEKLIEGICDYVDYTPQPHQLLRYSEFIDFDLEFIKSCLAQRNVPENEVEYYIRAFTNASLRRIHTEIYVELEKCISVGVPDKEKFKDFLKKVGIKDFLIPYYLILYDIVLLRTQVYAYVNVYKTQLYYDLITPQDFVDKCIKLGVNKELAIAWAQEIEARKKRLWVPSG
jgi:hypothetical protein